MELRKITNLKKDRRAVLALDTITMFFMGILVLAIISIAIFLALDSLVVVGVVSPTDRVGDGSPMVNDTITLNDSNAATPAELVPLVSVIQSDIVMINASGGEIIQPANFTVVGSTYIFTGTVNESLYNGTSVQVSALYTHIIDSDASNLKNNVTLGVSTFFASIPVVFVILIAVVIILAVLLIILAIRRFTGGALGGSDGNGGFSMASSGGNDPGL